MASSSYGVTSTGYVRPTEADIVQEIIDCFPDDLQFEKGDFETDLLEGLTKLRMRWLEQAECDFNAQNDFKLAKGCLLDVALEALGYIRIPGETDAEAIARVCLEEAANKGNFERGLEGTIGQLDGVCRVKIYTPKDRLLTGNENCQVEVVVQGGDKAQIAPLIWECSAGLENVGNTECRFEDEDGICVTLNFSVAVEKQYCFRVLFKSFKTDCGTCDAATFASVQNTIFEVLTSKDRCVGLGIGGTIRKGLFQIPGIEIEKIQYAPILVDPDSGECICDQHEESDWIDGPLTLGYDEVLSVPDASCVCVMALPGSI